MINVDKATLKHPQTMVCLVFGVTCEFPMGCKCGLEEYESMLVKQSCLPSLRQDPMVSPWTEMKTEKGSVFKKWSLRNIFECKNETLLAVWWLVPWGWVSHYRPHRPSTKVGWWSTPDGSKSPANHGVRLSKIRWVSIWLMGIHVFIVFLTEVNLWLATHG